MKWLDDIRRPGRTEEDLRRYPVTTVLTVLFSVCCGLGLIYIFVFSDTDGALWWHSGLVFAGLVFLCACLVLAKRSEDRKPMSLAVRRAVWRALLFVYAVSTVVMIWLSFSTIGAIVDVLRLACYLGGAATFPYIAWQLLRRSRSDGKVDSRL